MSHSPSPVNLRHGKLCDQNRDKSKVTFKEEFEKL